MITLFVDVKYPENAVQHDTENITNLFFHVSFVTHNDSLEIHTLCIFIIRAHLFDKELS